MGVVESSYGRFGDRRSDRHPLNGLVLGCARRAAARLNDEPLVRELARGQKFAGQSHCGEWLRQQNNASIAAL